MEKEQKMSKMVFKDYYSSLCNVEKEILRNAIMAESGMSYPTFYYKLRNDSSKPLELKFIDNIIKEWNGFKEEMSKTPHVVTPWNGTIITEEVWKELKQIAYDGSK